MDFYDKILIESTIAELDRGELLYQELMQLDEHEFVDAIDDILVSEAVNLKALTASFQGVTKGGMKKKVANALAKSEARQKLLTGITNSNAAARATQAKLAGNKASGALRDKMGSQLAQSNKLRSQLADTFKKAA